MDGHTILLIQVAGDSIGSIPFEEGSIKKRWKSLSHPKITKQWVEKRRRWWRSMEVIFKDACWRSVVKISSSAPTAESSYQANNNDCKYLLHCNWICLSRFTRYRSIAVRTYLKLRQQPNNQRSIPSVQLLRSCTTSTVHLQLQTEMMATF